MRMNVIVGVDMANVGAIITAIGGLGVVDSLNVVPADNGSDGHGVSMVATMPTAIPDVAGSGFGAANSGTVNGATARRATRNVGSGRASKVLVPVMVKHGRGNVAVNMDIATKMRKLTPIEERVATVIFKHAKTGGIPEAGVVKETGLNFHSVSGAVFSLRGARGAKPAIIASVPVPANS